MNKQEKEQQEKDAINFLSLQLKKDDQVFTIVRHVSASGMSRHISVIIKTNDGTIQNVSWHVSKALGWRMNKANNALVVGGCGMDMCFHTVYTLSRVLFGRALQLEDKTDAGYWLKQVNL